MPCSRLCYKSDSIQFKLKTFFDLWWHFRHHHENISEPDGDIQYLGYSHDCTHLDRSFQCFLLNPLEQFSQFGGRSSECSITTGTCVALTSSFSSSYFHSYLWSLFLIMWNCYSHHSFLLYFIDHRSVSSVTYQHFISLDLEISQEVSSIILYHPWMSHLNFWNPFHVWYGRPWPVLILCSGKVLVLLKLVSQCYLSDQPFLSNGRTLQSKLLLNSVHGTYCTESSILPWCLLLFLCSLFGFLLPESFPLQLITGFHPVEVT